MVGKKRLYESPNLEVVRTDNEDIVTASITSYDKIFIQDNIDWTEFN